MSKQIRDVVNLAFQAQISYDVETGNKSLVGVIQLRNLPNSRDTADIIALQMIDIQNKILAVATEVQIPLSSVYFVIENVTKLTGAVFQVDDEKLDSMKKILAQIAGAYLTGTGPMSGVVNTLISAFASADLKDKVNFQKDLDDALQEIAKKTSLIETR